ncbi:hypothetical protein ACQ4M3_03095 [Leptolyngbya sp. AN03gr2]|uniref:hypothetical protein n=1 Tax=unclassified Leptolyngbya TaxID=2650499 RepID=UPI003D313DBA
MLDHIGNLNPQLLRELKGRLTWCSFLTVMALSIVAQVLLFLSFYTQLPTSEDLRYSWYCAQIINGVLTRGCYDNPKTFVIDWVFWWQQIAQTLYTAIPFLLIAPGTYLLLSDLQNEERHGTLDFVRLSPQSATTILLGKILGVPILVYCAIASLIPFHLFITLKAELPVSFLLSFYLVIAAGAFLIFSFTLLFGFFSKSILKHSAQALGVTIAYVLIVSSLYVWGYLIWNSETTWKALLQQPITYFTNYADSYWTWYGLQISKNIAIAHLFTLTNVAILCAWIWQGLIRCFHQPTATILRKRQSYGLVLYLQIVVLGLSVQDQRSPLASDQAFGLIWMAIAMNLLIFLTLIAILTPQRQAVMDWARYRRSQSPRSSLLKDLLLHDQSPVGLSIALNLAIAFGMWRFVFSFEQKWVEGREETAIMLVFLSLTLMALYASIVQWIVIQRTRNRNFIAIGVIVLLTFVPALFASLLSLRDLISNSLRDTVILTSPFLWTLVTSEIPTSIWSSLIAQFSLIAGINALIARQVHHIGASELKASRSTKLLSTLEK